MGKTRTHCLEKIFYDSGQFYRFRISSLGKTSRKSLVTGYIEINELASQDNDSEADWKMAEVKYKPQNG